MLICAVNRRNSFHRRPSSRRRAREYVEVSRGMVESCVVGKVCVLFFGRGEIYFFGVDKGGTDKAGWDACKKEAGTWG